MTNNNTVPDVYRIMKNNITLKENKKSKESAESNGNMPIPSHKGLFLKWKINFIPQGNHRIKA